MITAMSKSLPEYPTPIPIGYAAPWAGEIIPEGWAMADGENGTDDLRSVPLNISTPDIKAYLHPSSDTFRWIQKIA